MQWPWGNQFNITHYIIRLEGKMKSAYTTLSQVEVVRNSGAHAIAYSYKASVFTTANSADHDAAPANPSEPAA